MYYDNIFIGKLLDIYFIESVCNRSLYLFIVLYNLLMGF